MGNYQACFQGYGLKVNVDNTVLDIWHKHKQLKQNQHESFGVIIGSSNDDAKEYWIESVTTPYPGDSSTRRSFHLKDSGHQVEANKAFESTQGISGYIGTWHTHPESDPTPSWLDKRDWKKCAFRNQDRRLLFVIVGIKASYLYVKVGHQFVGLTMNLEDKAWTH